MPNKAKTYRYSKHFLLNALYDTIDKMGLVLKSAQSDLGMLTVRDRRAGVQMDIHVIPAEDALAFVISLERHEEFPADGPGTLEDRFFYMLDDTLKKALG